MLEDPWNPCLASATWWVRGLEIGCGHLRPSAIGFGFVLALCLVSGKASGHSLRSDPGAHDSRAARPSDLLPKPLPCGAKNAKVESCLLTSVVGTLRISPHIVRPGKVVTARIEHFSCIDVPLTGPCPVSWQQTGPSGAPFESVASYLKPITPCGKLDHICRWRVSNRAPTTHYGVLGVDFGHTEGSEGAETFSAVINNYIGILGPKPPPPLPKPVPPESGPPSQPITPMPPP